jgi:hypothetical protein
MHDRAAEPIGATTSATAVATEIMILLSIEVRIAQVRLPVEEKRSELLRTYSRAFSAGMAANLSFLARIFFVGNFFKPFAIMVIIIHPSTIRKQL